MTPDAIRAILKIAIPEMRRALQHHGTKQFFTREEVVEMAGQYQKLIEQFALLLDINFDEEEPTETGSKNVKVQ